MDNKPKIPDEFSDEDYMLKELNRCFDIVLREKEYIIKSMGEQQYQKFAFNHLPYGLKQNAITNLIYDTQKYIKSNKYLIITLKKIHHYYERCQFHNV